MRPTTWAGWIMVVLGAGHLLITGIISRSFFTGWLSGDAWIIIEDHTMNQSQAHFWLVLGSFGLPLLLLGALTLWLARQGMTPPSFVGWALGLWGVVCSVGFEPSPFPTVLIPAALLIIAARKVQRT